MVLDDLGPQDFEADWVWPSRLARSRAAAEAKIREYSDPDYEPWEEVNGKWDHSVSENMDSEGMEFPNHSCGGSSNLQNFHIGESSRSAAAMDTCETDGISCLRVVPNDPCVVVSSGYAAMNSKVGCHFRAGVSGSSDRCEKLEEPGKYLMSGGGMKLRHRKKVILGREFLLVSRHCLHSFDKRFRFFHMPSHSAVEVKVKEPSLTVNQPCSPDPQKSHEGCIDALESDHLLVGVPDLLSPSRMEVVEEFPSSPSSYVIVSPTPELSLEDSSSNKVGDDLKDSVSGPRFLRAKRIVAFWRYRVEDCDGSTVRHSDSQKQKKVDGIEGTDGCDKPIPPSLWSKRKRETVIEEDPHSYRAPQHHAFH